MTAGSPTQTGIRLAVRVSDTVQKLTPDKAGTYKVKLLATDRYDPRPGIVAQPLTASVTVR